MINRIGVGVIGAGRIGRLHAENLRRLPGFSLRGIADMAITNELIEWTEERELDPILSDGETILNDPEIAVVFICRPTDSHADWIKRAAMAGKHIFCEKPISLSNAETAEALQIVKEAGVKLQVGFTGAWSCCPANI